MTLFGKRHSRLEDNDAHGIVWKSVGNAAARLALSLDRNWLVVHQQDNDTLWVVVDKDTPTWVEITAAGAAAVTSVFGRTGDVTAQTGDYSKTNVGLGNVENLKVNLGGTADPGVGDDSGDGYAVGSLWINTTADTAWICLDATAGAAVWKDTTASGTGSGDVSFTGGAVVDNQIARYDANGNQIQGGTSQPTIDDGGNFTSSGGVECDDLQVNGDAQIDGELAVSTVFNVDATGIQVLTGDIAVAGTVDGVDVAQLKTDFDTHDGGTSGHPNFSTSAATAGFAPGSNGQTTYFLRGDGQWAAAPAGGSAVSVYDEGVQLTTGVTKFDFVGTGVTVDEPVDNEVRVTIAGGAAPVSSVFSRTGAVVAATSDYDAIQIDNTPAGNIVATNVQAAINELDTDKAAADHNHDAAYAPLGHVGAGGTAHANVIAGGAAGFMTGADKTKLDGIEAGATAAGSTGDAYATSHESDSTAHDASEIVNTPAGNIVATTVQAAINELDGDKASTALFSTSSTTAGLAPGSNNLGTSYFLSGAGTWLQPAGTGGGEATPRLRAQAATTGDINANVLITGAGGTPNLTATLLDYTGLTFEDDVEIYINGKLMRGGPTAGANFDVYPSAVAGEISAGAFYCEFALTSDDVIQMFYGGGVTINAVTKAELDAIVADANLISDSPDEFATSAIVQKATPIGADRLLLEDSADSWEKKWALLSALPGADTFLELTDTPDSYSGQGSKFVAVNSGGTALEFVTSTPGGGDVIGGATAVKTGTNYGEIPAYTSVDNINRSELVVGTGTAAVGTRHIASNGVLAGGYISTGGTIQATGSGAVALGTTSQFSGVASITASGLGSVALGSVASLTNNATISASGDAAFAQGRVATIAQGNGSIAAAGAGSFVQGWTDGAATIETTSNGHGAIAHGYAIGGTIQASQAGAMAHGYVSGTGSTIVASASGAVALGYAINGDDIVASANNAMQLGVGTNALATSIAVGDVTTTGLRLCGGGTPGTPQSGDIWSASASDNVSIYTGGTTLTFSRPTITGSRGGNAALASLLTALATMGLIVDSTSA